MSTENSKAAGTNSKNRRNERPRKSTKKDSNSQKDKSVKKTVDESSDEDGELCFICAESIETYAVSHCDHRTCHRCSLRLRALYETRNCAYCKTEQKTVIFTKDPEKSFEEYTEKDTPYVDKKLGIKFETQEMYKDSMHLLDFNCPEKDCPETFKNWPELKQHVKKAHTLNICDLCSRFKKVFPEEHSLYTSAQLSKHHKEGDKDFNKDDETGFSGHPECEFCKIRFYGNDELFVHCRDQHEQCFLCVRNGKHHQYYSNYASLEDHFKSDHYICQYSECIEKKFVVFDSPIDLKGHEVEVHGESMAGMQRAFQTQTRQLELNFQYESYRDQRTNNSNNKKGKKKEETNDRTNRGTSSSSAAPQDFPTLGNSNEPATTQPRSVPGASSKKGKGIQRPAGFGGLSQAEPSSSQGSSSAPVDVPSRTDAPSSVVANHSLFLSKVGDMLQNKAKVAEFRSCTGAFRKNELTGEEYVNKIFALANSNVDISNKIFKGVEDLMDIQEKKWELVRAWRNKQTAMVNFPALDVKEKVAPKTARVLVIKPPKQIKKSVGGNKSKSVWNKPSTSTTMTSSTSSTTSSKVSSAHTSARSSPQSSRPSSPINSYPASSRANSSPSSSKTTQTNDFPSLTKPSNFPSLPKAPPKHQIVMNMRKNNNAQSSAWGSSGNNTDDGYDSTATEESTSSSKKKKGRKNNVLFRVGL